VFFDASRPLLRAGFDVIIGNPPYEVLAERESGQDLSALRCFIDLEPQYAATRHGKQNLYKLFVARGLALLADRGRLGLIVPMPILGDEQAVVLRQEILRIASFTSIEAFPQKDDPDRRVFREAKLSTAVFTLVKDPSTESATKPFRSRRHDGAFVEEDSPGLTLTTADIPLYDPSNFTIVSCDQADWDLVVRIMRSGRMGRLGDYATSYQGEVNETNERKAGRISYDSRKGPEVIRGAHICLYSVREASQGTPVYLLTDRFLSRPGRDQENLKAFHHRYSRVGFQRKSPQNNFRRLIAAPIPAGTFLLESVSYVPEHRSRLKLDFLLALLNTILADWYFRIGSTNAQVGEYQFNNLPCPVFAPEPTAGDLKIQHAAESLVAAGDLEAAGRQIRPLLDTAPFSPIFQDLIAAAARKLIEAEAARGPISRQERSSLSELAQPYQDFVDELFYRLAGLTPQEVMGLEARHKRML
jgi:hypothetical protein